MTHADPIKLASEARAMLQTLHKRNDVVVRFKSNQSGFAEDALSELDEEQPGHFRADRRELTLNLDDLAKKSVTSLEKIEDFRKHPVLAGVAAHESAHARWSLWGTVSGSEFPETIPNPDFDPTHEHVEGACEENCTILTVEFSVKEDGHLAEVAKMLEEPRVERLGSGVFTKTWRTAMRMSAAHLIMEGIDEASEAGLDPLDEALALAISVGGRLSAGTLGITPESRKAVRKVLDNVEKIIDNALPEVTDPYLQIMSLISAHVFSNEHEDAVPHLESARQILKILHPEQQDDPDEGGSGSEGAEGSEEGEGSEGSEAGSAMMQQMKAALDEAVDEMAAAAQEEITVDADKGESDGGGGYGAVVHNDRNAPGILRHEMPNAEDRELYKRATEWMERQIEPTITEGLHAQWLPGGGARLNVRRFITDNLADNKASQRSDWDKVSETVKHAPPVKVAIMLDGSGSMTRMARPSASIAWAAANAAANLPESRTVSVVYGDGAAVTQEPGHVPAKTIAVSNTDGGWENWSAAAKLVNDALWLDEPVEEGEASNVLIIVVSDLYYGGHGQATAFTKSTKEWHEKGFKTVVVGAGGRGLGHLYGGVEPAEMEQIELVEPGDLFK